MTSLLPTPEPADPVEGEPGHFDHSNWVKASVKALDTGTVHKAGDSMENLTVSELTIDKTSGQDSFLNLVGDGIRAVLGKTAGGFVRWRLQLGDSTAEGGANSGSLFGLFAHDDAGNQLHQVLKGSRADGLLEVKGNPTAALGVATKQYVDSSMPIGAIIAYGGSSAPAGWHICNGTAHGSSALQAILGSANTPDLSGRFIVGSGTGYNPGATGGVASNTLTPAQTATKGHSHTGTANSTNTDHTHTVDPPATQSGGHNTDHSHYVSLGAGGHGHNIAYGNNWQGSLQEQNPAGSDYAPVGNGPSQFGQTATAGDHGHAGQSNGASTDHSHNVNIGAFTSGAANSNASHTHGLTVNATTDANATASIENRPPYYALVYIIKKA
jgi:microcystin-dependent protein